MKEKTRNRKLRFLGWLKKLVLKIKSLFRKTDNEREPKDDETPPSDVYHYPAFN